MAFTSFVSGVNTSFSSQLNSNFLPTKIAEIYTGSGFDCSRSASAGTTTNNTTLSLTSSEIDNATYVLLSISYYMEGQGSASNSSVVALRVERRDSGGSYTDLLPVTSVGAAQPGASTASFYGLQTILLPITLTSLEKSAGLDIKITAQASLGGSFGAAIITNKGVILHTSY